MMFFVTPEVFARHPGAMIGVIVARGLENSGEESEVAMMLREAEQHMRETMDAEKFKDHRNIAAMQEVHRSFGNNPNKYPPSVQALAKRVLKGGQLPTINTLVDLYNLISLRHVVCVGAEDLDRCEGDIRLAHADGSEPFLPLGEGVNDPPEAGELVYKDDAGVICRKLNWREGDRTKITKATKNAVIVVEGFPPISRSTLDEILAELAGLTEKYCKAQTHIDVLTRENTQCSIA